MKTAARIQDAVDAIIKATLEGRIEWQLEQSDNFLRSIGNDAPGHAFSGNFAGLKLKLYDKEAKMLDFMSALRPGFTQVEPVNLEILEQGSNRPWLIPYMPKLDELLKAVQTYGQRLPPASVIDRILSEGQKRG